MTDREVMQQALEALDGVLDDDPKVLEASISGGLYEVVQCRDAITALRTALEQQAEPVAWRVWSPDGTNVYQYTEDGDGEPLYTTPPQRQWDKPSTSFNAWWDSYRHNPANPFAEGSAAYWAWAGWMAAQRPWVGLTDVDFLEACQIAERGNYLLAFQRIQIKLQERNT